MTIVEVIERVRARGGDLRVAGERLQYRPAGILSTSELDWLDRHRDDVVSALSGGGAERDAVEVVAGVAGPPLGEAGPGVPAWRCPIDLGSGHVRSARADGSSVCVTCHPLTLAPARLR
jgi:hypothetical protein